MVPARRRRLTPNHRHSNPPRRVSDSTLPAVSTRSSGAARTRLEYRYARPPTFSFTHALVHLPPTTFRLFSTTSSGCHDQQVLRTRHACRASTAARPPDFSTATCARTCVRGRTSSNDAYTQASALAAADIDYVEDASTNVTAITYPPQKTKAIRRVIARQQHFPPLTLRPSSPIADMIPNLVTYPRIHHTLTTACPPAHRPTTRNDPCRIRCRPRKLSDHFFVRPQLVVTILHPPRNFHSSLHDRHIH